MHPSVGNRGDSAALPGVSIPVRITTAVTLSGLSLTATSVPVIVSTTAVSIVSTVSAIVVVISPIPVVVVVMVPTIVASSVSVPPTQLTVALVAVETCLNVRHAVKNNLYY